MAGHGLNKYLCMPDPTMLLRPNAAAINFHQHAQEEVRLWAAFVS